MCLSSSPEQKARAKVLWTVITSRPSLSWECMFGMYCGVDLTSRYFRTYFKLGEIGKRLFEKICLHKFGQIVHGCPQFMGLCVQRALLRCSQPTTTNCTTLVVVGNVSYDLFGTIHNHTLMCTFDRPSFIHRMRFQTTPSAFSNVTFNEALGQFFFSWKLMRVTDEA